MRSAGCICGVCVGAERLLVMKYITAECVFISIKADEVKQVVEDATRT